MENILIRAARLNGSLKVPSSKSIGHRAIICAGLAQGTSVIENIMISEDIAATLQGMAALGAKIDEDPDQWLGAGDYRAKNIKIKGSFPLKKVKDTVDCRESGSTLRFLIPLAAIIGKEITFTGQGRLVERPLNEYYRLFSERGLVYENEQGRLPLTLKGALAPGTFQIRGDVSSQFITGLMFALPLLKGDSKIVITTEMESKPYVDLTLDVLKRFGIRVENRDYNEFLIPGGQVYNCHNFKVEADYSQAAFWIVAGLIGEGTIHCLDLNPDSLQGDRVIIEIARRMGGSIEETKSGLKVSPSLTTGTKIDVAQCPDLVPVLAVLGALSQGKTEIVNAGRLRMKESDRLRAIATELNKLGARVQELKEGLKIEGVENLKGGAIVDSHNDHRIAMALAIAALRCEKPVRLTGFGAVKKSYPHFWADYSRLGGKIK
ncbi:MAG: 3-phosphoshikimate 1-carboxyvinyltransferase [Desulfitobacteriia bacterium]